MGNRQGHESSKGVDEPDGKMVERSGSKRGSGRKKKKDAPDSSVNNGKKIDANKNQVVAPTKTDEVIRRSVDDGELGKRPKMGRLSGSFAAPETRSSRKSNFPAIDEAKAEPGMPKTAEVKIYRSYTNLAEEKKVTMYGAEPSLAEVKIYRKAQETPLNPTQRAMSLPRGFGRTNGFADTGNGNGIGAGRAAAFARNFPEKDKQWEEKRMSAPATRSATLPRLHLNSAPVASIAGYRVSKDDFPSTNTIQRKLKQFETLLLRSILTKFTRIDPVSQVSSIPIAVRQGGRLNQPITLRDYLEGAVPDDLVELSANGELALCIPPAMFTGMAHFRRERRADRSDWPTLSRDVVTCVSAEAAAEISRMFEYQISLVTGDSTMALLADHCADRIFSFIFQDLQVPRFDRNTLMQGAVRGKRPFNPQYPNVPQNPVFISVIVGMKELKWNLHEIFDRPGLRKDVLLIHDNVPAPGDDDRCPWKYYTAQSCDPMLYGYRGQLIEWDFVEGHFRLNSYEEASFAEEMSWRYDDFHRQYSPYRRLFGARAMKRYYTEQTRSGGQIPLPVDRFLLQAVHGVTYTRDAIQPVYRPLEQFTLADVDGVDLTNADVPRVLLPKKAGNGEVQTPLSPSGEYPVFTPAVAQGSQRYSTGGATQTLPQRYSRSAEMLAEPRHYSPGGGTPNIPQYYSPGGATANVPQYYSPGGGTMGGPQYNPQGGGTVNGPQYNPQGGTTAYSPQYHPPVEILRQRNSPTATVTMVHSFTPRAGTPTSPGYYSPGGTLRRLNSPVGATPPKLSQSYSLDGGSPALPRAYSPGGGNLPMRQSYSPSNDASTNMMRPYSPGGGTLAVPPQQYFTQTPIENGTMTSDLLKGYTLLSEVTTIHSLKASNV